MIRSNGGCGLVAACALACIAERAYATQTGSEPPRKRDEFVTRAMTLIPELMREGNVPGVAVALNRAGTTVWLKGFGVQGRGMRDPVDPDTVFSVGSISKSVAAWGVLCAAERGTLALDEPVFARLKGWRLPSSAYDAHGITPRRLLNHTAGLSLAGYPGWTLSGRLPSLERSLAGDTNGVGDVRLIAAPGSRVAYSGGGYALLQLHLEEATGHHFAEFMKRNVFEPLGMSSSTYEQRTSGPRWATGHDALGRPIARRLFAEQAAAGLNISARDLAGLAAALAPPPGVPAGRGVLTTASVAVLTGQIAAVHVSHLTQEQVGAGYFVYRSLSPRLIGHSGWNIGWAARYRIVPESGDALIVLTNGNGGAAVIEPLFCEWQKALDGAEQDARECRRSALPRLLAAFERLGWTRTAAEFETLRADARYDLNPETLSRLAHMLIHEAPGEWRTNRRVPGVLRLLELNLATFPSSDDATRALAEGYLRAGRAERARKLAAQALQLDPHDNRNLHLIDLLNALSSEDSEAHSPAPGAGP